MSFRDNLQHLRATRNMTQEQLAMLLGVSRQSVSKWEAERAYPEMDKLIKLCDIFDCTLDDLVSGDLTSRTVEPSQSMPSGMTPQDVVGYDDFMCRYASRVSSGVGVLIAACSLAPLTDVTRFSDGGFSAVPYVLFPVGLIAGLGLLIPIGMEYDAFQKAHPYIEDFYTTAQRDASRASFARHLVAGIAVLLGALALGLRPLMDDAFVGTRACMAVLLVAVGFWVIIRSVLLNGRLNIDEYNEDALSELPDDSIATLPDESLHERARRAKRMSNTYGAVMLVATAIALVLLFVPAFHAQSWFWLLWPLGGIACGIVGAVEGLRGK